MKTVFIGFTDDDAVFEMKGIAIRIAWLLSEQIRIAGNVSSLAVMEENLRNISLEQKMKFIDEREKDRPEPVHFYEHYRDFKKVYKKDRGHNKELIVLQKKTEKVVNDLFNSVLERVMSDVKMAGLADFKTMEQSAAYGEYFIRYNDAENAEDGCSRLSDILRAHLDEEDNETPPVFILTAMFFSPGFKTAEADMPVLNAFSEKGFLQELFTIPNYNDFSITDVNTIRYTVKKSLEDFQQSVNEFTALITNPEAAFNYLQSNTVAAAKTLAESTSKTGIVAGYSRMMPAENNLGKLYLGLIPRHLIFRYFEYIKASQEETIAVLQQLPEEDGMQLVPVLINSLEPNEFAVQEEPGITKAELLPLKKSLSAD